MTRMSQCLSLRFFGAFIKRDCINISVPVVQDLSDECFVKLRF